VGREVQSIGKGVKELDATAFW